MLLLFFLPFCFGVKDHERSAQDLNDKIWQGVIPVMETMPEDYRLQKITIYLTYWKYVLQASGEYFEMVQPSYNTAFDLIHSHAKKGFEIQHAANPITRHRFQTVLIDLYKNLVDEGHITFFVNSGTKQFRGADYISKVLIDSAPDYYDRINTIYNMWVAKTSSYFIIKQRARMALKMALADLDLNAPTRDRLKPLRLHQ